MGKTIVSDTGGRGDITQITCMTLSGTIGTMAMWFSPLVKVLTQPRTVFLAHITRLMNMESVLTGRETDKTGKKIDAFSGVTGAGNHFSFHVGGTKYRSGDKDASFFLC